VIWIEEYEDEEEEKEAEEGEGTVLEDYESFMNIDAAGSPDDRSCCFERQVEACRRYQKKQRHLLFFGIYIQVASTYHDTTALPE
jgi:hypothetical protein